MTIRTVYYSSSFKKQIKKYQAQHSLIKKKIGEFINDPFSPRLKTHKLSGKLDSYWSFSVSYRLRILFEFIDKESVGLIDIGTHEIYK